MELHLNSFRIHANESLAVPDACGTLSMSTYDSSGTYYFVLRDGIMYYYPNEEDEESDHGDEPSGVLLVLSAVATKSQAKDGSYSFDLISGDQWLAVFTAPSEKDCDQWVECLQLGALKGMPSPDRLSSQGYDAGHPTRGVDGSHVEIQAPGNVSNTQPHDVKASFDKLFGFEVQWRKYKLMEEQLGVPASLLISQDGNGGHAATKNLPKKLVRTLGLSPSSTTSVQSNTGTVTEVFADADEEAEVGEQELVDMVKNSPNFGKRIDVMSAELDRVAARFSNMLRAAEAFLTSGEASVEVGSAMCSDIVAFARALSPLPTSGAGSSAEGEGGGVGSFGTLKEIGGAVVDSVTGGSGVGGGGAGGATMAAGSAVADGSYASRVPQVHGDAALSASVERVSSLLRDLLILQSVLDSQLRNGFLRPLRELFAQDVKEARNAKRQFQEAQSRYDAELKRFLHGPAAGKLGSEKEREKEAAAESRLALLRRARDALAHDVWAKLTAFHQRKGLEYLERLLDSLYIHLSYFQRGCRLLEEKEQTFREQRTDTRRVRKRLLAASRAANERYAALVEQHTSDDIPEALEGLAARGSGLRRSGFLLRADEHAFGVVQWRRRWFELADGQFYYRKSADAAEMKGTIDLLLTSVRIPANAPKRFVFEVVCAAPRVTYVLQAENERDRREWCDAIQATTANLLGISPSSSSSSSSSSGGADDAEGKQGEGVDAMPGMSVKTLAEGNGACVDCGTPSPEWASINLGVTLCIDCAGVHRSIGTHVSKVRSLAMDAWPAPLLEMMRLCGNSASLAVWEALPPGDAKPGSKATRAERETFIRAKYVDKAYVNRAVAPPAVGSEAVAAEVLQGEGLNRCLTAAAAASDMGRVLWCLAAGADSGWQDPDHQLRGATHAAAAAGCVAPLEALLLNGWPVAQRDSSGQTPLHLAAVNNELVVVKQLVEQHAAPALRDQLGRTPAQVAATRGHAECAALAAEAEGDAEETPQPLNSPVQRAMDGGQISEQQDAAARRSTMLQMERQSLAHMAQLQQLLLGNQSHGSDMHDSIPNSELFAAGLPPPMLPPGMTLASVGGPPPLPRSLPPSLRARKPPPVPSGAPRPPVPPPPLAKRNSSFRTAPPPPPPPRGDSLAPLPPPPAAGSRSSALSTDSNSSSPLRHTTSLPSGLQMSGGVSTNSPPVVAGGGMNSFAFQNPVRMTPPPPVPAPPPPPEE